MAKNEVLVFESDGSPLPDGAVDGMAEIIAEAEANGWEGEHVFDASVEDPPHPFWNAKERRCYTDEEMAELERNRKN